MINNKMNASVRALTLLAVFTTVMTFILAPGRPLTAQASATFHPGKFVWADLYTPDTKAAADYYRAVFGWKAEKSGDGPEPYFILKNEGRPVGGIAYRPPTGGVQPAGKNGRWLGYVSVNDVINTSQKAEQAGATVKLPPRQVPGLGMKAILQDPSGGAFGLMQLEKADPKDQQPTAGRWAWAQLLTPSPIGSALFYSKIVGYQLTPLTALGHPERLFLSMDGVFRAGVAPVSEVGETEAAWLGFVMVKNLDASLKKAQSSGGKIIMTPRPAAAVEATLAAVIDPSGGIFGMVEFSPAKP